MARFSIRFLGLRANFGRLFLPLTHHTPVPILSMPMRRNPRALVSNRLRYRRFLNAGVKTLATHGDAFHPGLLPATLVLGDGSNAGIFLEHFQIRIP